MPFRNLKFLIMFNKAFGFVSCKLVNGQLRPSSIWSCCFCVIWLLFHCLYRGVYYYMMYTASKDEERLFALSIVRFSAYTASLLPYNAAAAFWSEDFVKLSDKLLAYDEQAVILGYPRKDKHVFINLFFVYTFVVISWLLYYNVGDVSEGIWGVITALQAIILEVTSISCILISCTFLDLIRQRFRHLNEMIVPHISQLPITGSQGEITVYDVRHLHRMLLNGAELISTLYGFGALLVFLSMLLDIVTITYLLSRNMQENGSLELLNLLFQTIYLSAMYHFTTYEANRVEEGVIKYGLPFSSEKCRIDKIEMMLYFYHRRYTFTAAGFFPLNLTMLLSMATLATTLITLMI